MRDPDLIVKLMISKSPSYDPLWFLIYESLMMHRVCVRNSYNEHRYNLDTVQTTTRLQFEVDKRDSFLKTGYLISG